MSGPELVSAPGGISAPGGVPGPGGVCSGGRVLRGGSSDTKRGGKKRLFYQFSPKLY